MGSRVKSLPSQSSRIQAVPSIGGVHSNLTDRSPLLRRSCLVFRTVSRGPSRTDSPSMDRMAVPVPRSASSARVLIGRLRVPEKFADQFVGAMPIAGDSPASTRAANKRVGKTLWFVPSEKETVTPAGRCGAEASDPRFNPMARRQTQSIES